MANYRTPTEQERKKLDEARALMQEGIEGEQDLMSKILPTAAKAARDDIKRAKAKREAVSAAARAGEDYEQAGYKNGGYVRAADGCAQRGKTKGRMI